MNLGLIPIAVAAVAFDLVAMNTLVRPPLIFAAELGFMLVWLAASLKGAATTANWLKWVTGIVTVFGPARWMLFDWCLLVERCVA